MLCVKRSAVKNVFSPPVFIQSVEKNGKYSMKSGLVPDRYGMKQKIIP